MASPLKSIGKFLFGGSSNQQLPMIASMPATPPEAPPPVNSPQGSPGTWKAKGAPSFIGATTPPPQVQTPGKSLLGQ